jgi:hypothetical protein
MVIDSTAWRSDWWTSTVEPGASGHDSTAATTSSATTGRYDSIRFTPNAGWTSRRRRRWSSPSLTIRAVSPSIGMSDARASRHRKFPVWLWSSSSLAAGPNRNTNR